MREGGGGRGGVAGGGREETHNDPNLVVDGFATAEMYFWEGQGQTAVGFLPNWLRANIRNVLLGVGVGVREGGGVSKPTTTPSSCDD